MIFVIAAARLAIADPEALAAVAESLKLALSEQRGDVPGYEWCSQLGRAQGLAGLLAEREKLLEWTGLRPAAHGAESDLDTLRRQAEAMAMSHEVEGPRTMCDICGRDIEPTREVPLCRTCLGTARAAGKQEQDARRYPDPGRAEVPS